MTVDDLIDKMLAGAQRPLARLISLVEREDPAVPSIIRRLYAHLGNAYSIGVTGPPGAGKSTLLDKLTALLRKQGLTVGIIAADPSSPFSGGALLGDRIRMQQHYLDPGVFIRSMATKGSHGGLPRCAKDVIKLMDAAGKDVILVETVGVGQTELDIVETTDTTVVLLVPEAGDAIQTLKAGLMEIADIFVVNKADREGADRLMQELHMMLGLKHAEGGWVVPVLATQAHQDIGIAEFYAHVETHRRVLEESGQLQRRRALHRRSELWELVERKVRQRLMAGVAEDPQLATLVEHVMQGQLDPYSAVSHILDNGETLRRWLIVRDSG
ncbi:MAG: methylmalonyl Co-A mutase-associated GTPase MeaB [Nitrospinae bacterium]|nr:methylmalonyl Co-A mutase-associated GTPase MeaB [Nitrospinota bacterium]